MQKGKESSYAKFNLVHRGDSTRSSTCPWPPHWRSQININCQLTEGSKAGGLSSAVRISHNRQAPNTSVRVRGYSSQYVQVYRGG